MKIFLHGLESSSRGTKASYLRDLYPEIIVPDFTGSLAERMASLNSILAGKQSIKIIGSSFGGLMATVFAMENQKAVDRIMLLAPALNFFEFSSYEIQRIPTPTWVIIGRDDTVTPAAEVVPLARRIYANLKYDEVEDDHMLAKTFRDLDWKTFLEE